MKRYLTFGFIFAISVCSSFAQPEEKQLAEGEDLFLNAQFAEASSCFQHFLKTDSSNANLNFKIGVCYLNSRSQKTKAIKYLERSVGSSSPIVVYKFLGDAYHLANRFDPAIASYTKFKKAFLATGGKDRSVIEEVNWKMEMCQFGKKVHELDSIRNNLAADSYPDKNAKSNANFNYIDYTSALSLDQSTMTFTFQRPAGTKKKVMEDGKYFEEFYIPLKADTDNEIRTIVDTSTYVNETTVATSVDGQVVLSYKDDNGDCNLYITRLVGNRWKVSEKVNKPVNTKGWEQNECISTDGYTLYFTSDRPGGFGGKDIYFCKKLPDGEWGKAINLGSVINTSYDEEAPFIYSDGLTLFFSSNKYKLKEHFDIFSSTLANDGIWTKPVKVGYPEKTLSDEILYAKISDQKEILPAAGKDADDKSDMYLATFIDSKEIPFTILKGKVIHLSEKGQESVRIIVTDNETGEVLGAYHSNYKTGEYIIPLQPGKNSNITYEAANCLFQSENMDINKKVRYFELQGSVQMPSLVPGSKVVLNNIFFDTDKNTLRSVSNVELNRLFLLLSADPGMAVELTYYMDLKENAKFKTKFAQERAQAVADYLIIKGIEKERVIVKEAGKIKTVKPKGKKNKEEEEQLGERLELKIADIKQVKRTNK